MVKKRIAEDKKSKDYSFCVRALSFFVSLLKFKKPLDWINFSKARIDREIAFEKVLSVFKTVFANFELSFFTRSEEYFTLYQLYVEMSTLLVGDLFILGELFNVSDVGGVGAANGNISDPQQA